MSKSLVSKMIAFFFPKEMDEIIQKEGSRILEKYQVFISMLVLFDFIAFFFGMIHLFIDGFNKKALIQVGSFTFLAICLSLVKFTRQFKLTALLPFIVAAVHLPNMLYQHGTILSPTPLWFVIMPPLLAYFISFRVGIIGTVIFMTEFLVTCFLIKDGAPFSTKEIVMVFSTFFATGVWILFIILFEKTKVAYESQLQQKLLDNAHAANLASLGEMAGSIAHEINNPLAIIKGNSQALISRCEDAALNKRAVKINETVDRIYSITQTLLKLSRKEMGESLEKITFGEIFDLVEPIVRQKVNDRGIELRVKEEDRSEFLKTEPQILAQALINLISNSIFAIASFEEKWISLDVQNEGEETRILIKDSGRGIPHEVVDRMWEPFFTTKGMGHGTGLGLSLTRSSIESMGGSIFYIGNLPHTTFAIKIPNA